MTRPPIGNGIKRHKRAERMFRKQNSESGNWLAWRVEGREELRVIQSFPPGVTKNMVRILAG